MSKQVDERVVSMQFDNKRFESNVQTTLNTLDKLKQSLNLKGATKGLEEVDAASKRINMSGLGSAVETVNAKFSALGVMGVTALANITNSAVNAGKQMVKSLTIDPIKTGFQEYETQINSIQTILANTESKGSTLQDVNGALAELNTYADKTIYNFTEMTRNIGTFTAAGVDLDTSVSAIKGIANLAAVSGSTSQQASTAMYQLSQALSSGTVKLMDWNSVVNAGMGGQVFQDALKETARVHGVAIDDMIKNEGSFRETLKEGWLTSEILTETLSKFTGDLSEKQLKAMGYTDEQIKSIVKMGKTANDAATKVKTFTQLFDTLKEAAQSGWTKTWEIIVGDFGEAKDLLTEISDTFGGVIGASADKRNNLLSGALSTGWKQLLNEGITDAAGFEEQVTKTAKKHGVDLSKMIDDETTFQDTLKEGWMTTEILSESVTKYGKKLKDMSAKELEAAGYTAKDVKAFEELEKKLKDGSVSLEEFSKLMKRPSGRELLIESLRNSLNAVLSIINPVKEAFGEIFPALKPEQLYNAIESLRDFTSSLTISEGTADKLKRTFKGVFALFDIGYQAVKALVGGFLDLVGYIAPAGNSILGFTAGIGDFIVGIDEAIKSSNLFGKIIETIGSFLKPIADGVKAFAKSISSAFTEISGKAEVRLEPLKVLGNAIKAIFVGIGNILQKVAPWVVKAASGIGNILKSLMDKITSSVQNADYDKLFDLTSGGIMTAIGVFIAKFMKGGAYILNNAGKFLKNINNILKNISKTLNAFSQSIKADALKKIATAIGILAASLLVISLIDSEKLTASLGSVTVMFVELMGAMSIFEKISGGKGLKDAFGMNIIANAMTKLAKSLLILAVAMKIMSTMSWEGMGVALISLTVGLGALVGAVALLALIPDKDLKNSANAIKKLSSSLLVLAVALKIMSTMSPEEMGVALISMAVGLGVLVGAVRLLPNDTGSRAAGMIGLAAAMVILGAALKIMGSMSWEELKIGLSGMAVALFEIIVAMALMKNAMPGAKALLVIAPALVILSAALKILGSMSLESIIKSLSALAVSLLIIAGGMALMKKAMEGAKALIVVAAALLILTPALMALGSMSWEEIGRGLATIAGAFVVVGLAGLLLKPLVPTIMALSKSLALLGAACALVGMGVLALGAGLTMIAAAGGAAAVALVTIVSSLISLIPYLIEQIGVGIIRLCDVIAGGSAAICAAFTVIVLALVDAIVACVPAIVDGVLVLVVSLMESLVAYTPTIVKLLFDFIIGIINAIAEKLPDLIKAGVNLLMAYFQGIIDALKSIDSKVLVNGLLAVGLIAALVAALAAIAIMTPAAMIGVLGLGAVITELSIVLAAIGSLAQIPGLKWLVEEGGDFMLSVGQAVGKFIGGIVGGIAQGISSALPQIATDLSTFMMNIQPFIIGAKMIDPSSLEGVKALVGVIMAITAANVLEGITSWITGGSSISKFASELPILGTGLSMFSASLAGADMTAVSAAASAAKAICDMASHIPNEGGIVAWFTGENSIASWASQLPVLGAGLKMFSLSIAGMDAEAVTAAAGAAKAIADMSSVIPNEGGVASWFAGENSVANWASQLPILGFGLRAFSLSIAGMDSEAVMSATKAAKAIADMTSIIPNEGGVSAWFAGENSVASWARQLPALGMGLLAFSMSVSGIELEGVKSATSAAKAIADMTATIPNEGGVSAWFSGDNSVAAWASQLPVLGFGLKMFSLAIAGMDSEAVTSAAGAAKAIADMTSHIPNEGGVVAWFTGENSISKFASELPTLGAGLKSFAESLGDTNVDNLATVATAGKHLAQMTDTIPNNTSKLIGFGDNLKSFGTKLKEFVSSLGNVSGKSISAAIKKIKDIIGLAKTVAETNISSLKTFGESLKKIAKDGVNGFVKEFKSDTPKNDTKKAAKAIMDAFGKAAEGKKDAVKKKAKAVAQAAVDVLDSDSIINDAKSAGKNVVTGFANGIKNNKSLATDAGSSLGKAALKAAKEALDENSPSKEMYKVGNFAVLGFVNALKTGVDSAYSAGSIMADSAKSGLSDAISKVADVFDKNVDSQPTIRPVLDLSNVQSGASAISGMLSGRRTLAIDTSNIGAVSALMSGNQNGRNSADVVSAIKGLRKDIANMPRNTYSIGGITYGEGTEVADAINTLVRAAKMERRT